MGDKREQDDWQQAAEASVTPEAEIISAPGPEDDMADFDLEDYMTAYKQLLAEKDALAGEKAEVEAKLLRMQADFDNFRRRQRENNEEVVRQAAANLAEALLPVVDNLERALTAMQDTPDKQGVEMIYRQFMQTLENAGVAEIAATGEMFDPKLHQAVMQCEATEADKGRVMNVLQKGYIMHGRLLRAAMVQVGN
jgi:molecular chaperone GrpE